MRDGDSPIPVWCPSCGRHDEVSVQHYPGGAFYIATCRNKFCKLHDVTMSAGRVGDKTSAQCAIADIGFMRKWQVRVRFHWNTGHEVI